MISVITVNFNNKFGLINSFKSFENQTIKSKELIVIDGGSTDGSLEVIDEYKHLINQLVIGKDKGIYDAMNIGIGLTSENSAFIHFLNSGDTYYSNHVLNEFYSIPDLDKNAIYYGGIFKDNIVRTYPKEVNYRLLTSQMISHQALFISTKWQRQTPYDISYSICADYEFLLRSVKYKIRFKALSFPVARIEAGGVSATQKQKVKRQKVKIRKEYPQVYIRHLIRRLIKRLP